MWDGGEGEGGGGKGDPSQRYIMADGMHTLPVTVGAAAITTAGHEEECEVHTA